MRQMQQADTRNADYLLTVRDIEKMEAAEVIFVIYAFAFAMEEATSIKERGLATYTSQIWNMLDMGFMCT